MAASQIYIIITIIVLVIIGFVVFLINKNKKKEKLTTLTKIAFGFILAGIFSSSLSLTIFGIERILSYGLMGIGVVIAVIDMIKKSKKK